jgi:hypothetical protein
MKLASSLQPARAAVPDGKPRVAASARSSTMPDRELITRLYFVYNANSGTLAAIVDSAKKLLSINGCALCSLTHSLAGERTEWKTCRDTMGVAVDYVHRDELTREMKAIIEGEGLPCVLAQTQKGLHLLLTPDTIRRCNGSIADFRGRLSIHAAMRNLTLPSETDTVLTISPVTDGASPRAASSGSRPELRMPSAPLDTRP